ncbi:recombinase family protein [Microbacterium binotii]|uniref:recombinase family protein n=1 Tax=Microbacterium binotii TaxID=462710 RepID=UPI001F41256C|nr:recombinase family protein [Microbacterium binotii]UIN30633.1 recombinase family protein [Microbacterium binotii]
MSLLAVVPSVPSSSSVVSFDHADGSSASPELVLRAVSYLRVSTREQAERAGEREGFSIPAQRQANRKTAHGLGAWVVKEFVDAGESARSAARPALTEMLEWIRTNRVDIVVVHKLDRLARNRADDVQITQAIADASARLVSSTEAIDESPSGRLVHGIMASIAEFYSRNLATEVSKGLRQKAMNGGTPNKAPAGYRNVRTFDAQGREARIIEVDEERAQIIRWAFTTYATGEWSLDRLARGMSQLGFTLAPRAGKPPRALTVSVLQRMLRNPYYCGIVTYVGVEYPGTHEPLVEPALWQRVQDALTARRNTSTRDVHTHYLKGLLKCGECGSSMMYNRTRNNHGTLYFYFVCLGRHSGRTACTLKAQQVHLIETAVHRLIQQISLTPEERASAEERLLAEANASVRDADTGRAELQIREQDLRGEQERVLRAYYVDAISTDMLKREQDRIRRELLDIAQQLTVIGHQARHVASQVAEALDQLENVDQRFDIGAEYERRALCRTLFDRIDVQADATVSGSLRPRFAGAQ